MLSLTWKCSHAFTPCKHDIPKIFVNDTACNTFIFNYEYENVSTAYCIVMFI